MAKLSIVRGLPASGKTTWAKRQPDAWRVNRDDIRAMYTGVWDYGHDSMENLVTVLQKQLIVELLSRGCHVIVDDTNLDWRHVRMLASLVQGIRGVCVEVEVKEFLHVPISVCIERDAQRPNPVGETVILDMARKYFGGVDG